MFIMFKKQVEKKAIRNRSVYLEAFGVLYIIYLEEIQNIWN
jgi:hypothetical protein